MFLIQKYNIIIMYSAPPPPKKKNLVDVGTANREENYAKKAADFEHHSKRMADTASALAKTGGVTDRKLANDLISTSGKVCVYIV